MIQQLSAIWKFRYLLMALVRLDVRSRYQRSAIGALWTVLNPLVMTATFVVVFSNLLGADPRSYTKLLLLGMAVFGFFRECALTGCLSFVSHEAYIRQTPLPYGLYPLRLVLGQSIHSSIALGIALVAVVLADGTAANLAVAWAIIPALILILLCGWAVATVFSFAQVYFHDTRHLLEIGAQLLFFLTPIIYPPDVLVGKGLGWLCRINPVNLFLELIRTPFTTGQLPTADAYLKAVVGTAVLLVVALAVTSRYEKKVVFHL